MKKINFDSGEDLNEDDEINQIYAEKVVEIVSRYSGKLRDIGPDDMVALAINAWNLSNMLIGIPKDEMDEIIESHKMDDENWPVIEEMMRYKSEELADFDLFISDFEISQEGDRILLGVETVTKDDYLMQLMADISSMDFDEGSVNRGAIIIKPNTPFIKWRNAVVGESVEGVDKIPSVYLIDDGVNPVQFLKKEFDRIFTMELEGWSNDETTWPQQRSYMKFLEWFSFEHTGLIYDLEKKPFMKS